MMILRLSLIVSLIAAFAEPSPLSQIPSNPPGIESINFAASTKPTDKFDPVNKKIPVSTQIENETKENASNQLISKKENVQPVLKANIIETNDNKAHGVSHDGEKISDESEEKKQKEGKKLLAEKSGAAYSSLVSKKMIKNNFTMPSFSNDTTFWENNKTHELFLPFKVGKKKINLLQPIQLISNGF
jgi:hypothetical protein